MIRVAPEQLTFDFENIAAAPDPALTDSRGTAQILHFSVERLQERRRLADKERERRLLEEAERRVRYF
jgi:hypothetical protein